MTFRLLPSALLALTATAAAAAPRLPVLPPLVLPIDAPFITATIAGQPVTLRVDPAVDSDGVLISPAAAQRLGLAGDARPDGRPPKRGARTVMVGQSETAVPWSREAVGYAGIGVALRVLVAPGEASAVADGAVSPALLPHGEVRLVRRAATPADAVTVLKAETRGLLRADTIQADWPTAAGRLEVEFHPFRPRTIASVAAAARLRDGHGGQWHGDIQRVEVAFGVKRPVRQMQLARPAPVAGVMVRQFDVRLFDWAGTAELPPDAGEDAMATVVGRRGRQRGWPIIKLGHDALGACAEIIWQRQPAQMRLVCPAGN